MNVQPNTIGALALGLVFAFAFVQALLHLIKGWSRRSWEVNIEDDEGSEEETITADETTPSVEPIRSEPEQKPEQVDESTAELEPALQTSEPTSEQIGWIPPRVRNSVAHECAAHARDAFRRGVLIESYYFGRLAKMFGHRQIGVLLGQVRNIWRRNGCPSEKSLLHEDFSQVESAIGRAMLRIETGIRSDLGFSCLNELAEGGNEVAHDYLASIGALSKASEAESSQ